MADSEAAGAGEALRRYEITVEGRLDERWASWFDGMAIGHPATGRTVLSGLVRDQAALHGLLARVRDLNLVLVSVKRTDEE